MIERREDLAETPEHRLVLDCITGGIEAAHPSSVVETAVTLDGESLTIDGTTYDLREYDNIYVVGGGNAAGQVAAAIEDQLGGRIDAGIVVTDDPVPLSIVDCVKGNHPVPDESALNGVERMLDLTASATEDDLVLAIVTGGGSALLPAPADDLDLDDLRDTTEKLLTSGAAIEEINAVRKHLSAVKGGQLAQAASPASVIGLVFSDVVGNDLSTIASGPITPDGSTYHDAVNVIDRHDLTVPPSVRDHLREGIDGDRSETPAPGDGVFEGVSIHVLADNLTALTAAKDIAQERGYEPVILSSHVRGEASEAAKTHVGIAEEILSSGNPTEPPAVILSGGETTVTVTGDGEGGPNQEFALSAAIELDDPAVILGCVDTDGIDGNVDAAGAVVDSTTLEDVAAARTALDRNDVYDVLDDAEALVRTGPTGTNVNDFRVFVVPDR